MIFTTRTRNGRRPNRSGTYPVIRSVLALLLAVAALERMSSSAALHSTISTVKNLRPVVPGTIYRSASLDGLSVDDARRLLDGSAFGDGDARRPLAAVIDLRNDDEVRKGEKGRTDGSRLFYSSLCDDDVGSGGGADDVACGRIVRAPLLGDVDVFWDAAIARLDVTTRLSATLRTAFDGGALDRAAARNLERGGHALLYAVMLETGGDAVASALDACARESARGPVVFHCQKGKDRTGVISMLVQSCLGEDDDEIVKAYALSGELIGEGDGAAVDDDDGAGNSGGDGLVDWSHFRGSPPLAMADTLEWVRRQYGSVDGYLDATSFGAGQRKIFRELARMRYDRMVER